MSTEYKWASNQLKLQRARAASKGDESKVKELYISYGGLINKGYEEVVEVNNEVEIIAEKLAEEVLTEPTHLEVPVEIEEVADKIVEEVAPTIKINKRGRQAKNAQ